MISHFIGNFPKHKVITTNDKMPNCFGILFVLGSVAPSVTWVDDAKYDQQMDMDQEQISREKYIEERENEQFPDEVDTPENMPARLRFAR